MPIPAVRVVNAATKEERLVCVVDGQAYYCSTGKNSGMPGLWLPFEGVDIQIFSKPEVANFQNASFQSFFPSTLRAAIEDLQEFALIEGEYEDKHKDEAEAEKEAACPADHWGRFKSMECLYVSCLLSNQSKYPELRKQMQKYVGAENLPDRENLIASVDSAQEMIVIDGGQAWVYQLNQWLKDNEAALDHLPVSQQEDDQEMRRLLEERKGKHGEKESRTYTGSAIVSNYPETITVAFETYVTRIRNDYRSSLQEAAPPLETIIVDATYNNTINPMHSTAPASLELVSQHRDEISHEQVLEQNQRTQRSSCLSSITRAFGLSPRDATVRQEASSTEGRKRWCPPLPRFLRNRKESEASLTVPRL